MEIFEPTPGPSNPHNSFLVDGGMPHGNNNTYQDLPSGLAQLKQFMDDVSHPSPLGNRSPLLLTAPAPMKVNANTSPSKEAIWQSMTRMAKEQTKKVSNHKCWQSNIPLRRYSWRDFDLQTAEYVKDYIQHFAHPAICQN
ncbi:hypothetical protein DSO57_1019686 [Entomophthora muscae]|uniref:Uncharacterized protein n=1 Tax=Entomophthora muscae TaxID=34485 RepID=A0ACC2RV51_9FUNG|nr:hypothetical protein DSO57_1019686 [Entomophthora muscae]